MKCITSLIAIAAIFVAPLAASAAKIPLTAKITEDQATPAATGSDSLGVGSFTYDTDTDMLEGNILVLDTLLSSPETAAHIHGPGAAGVDAPVLHPLPLGDLKPVSVKVGDVGSSADLLANLWYINIHTGTYPDGEIRGQIEVVPEPGGVLLAGLGLIFLVGYIKRRQR